MTTRYCVLLPHPLEPRLLMLGSHGEWRLPAWEDATAHTWEETSHINRAVAARFGMETTVLRCVRESHHPDGFRVDRIYELENHSAPHDVIPASTWIGTAELELLRVPDAATREIMHAWFDRQRGERATGPPWSRPGWYIEALAWCIDRMRSAGVAATARPEQLEASASCFAMRIRAGSGAGSDAFIFRAAPLMFAHAPRLMEWLTRNYPLNVPELMAADAERGWTLVRDPGAGTMSLSEDRDPQVWYRAVRRLAEIQLETSRHSAELRLSGCPSRGLDVLARRIPRLCADESVMMLGHRGGLTRREIEQVRSLTPTLLALCEELASFQLPDCLDHGQVRADAVYSSVGEPVFSDWTASSIAHPFFSIWPLMHDAVSLLPATSRESQRRLRDAFLAPWRVTAPPERLDRALEIARCLAPAHRAATVHAELLPSTAFTWELETAIPELMRRTMAQLTATSPI